MSFLNSVKMSIFPRGLTMIFHKNLKFLLNLIFFEKGLGMMFDDVLDKEKKFSRLQKGHFKIVVKCPSFQRG